MPEKESQQPELEKEFEERFNEGKKSLEFRFDQAKEGDKDPKEYLLEGSRLETGMEIFGEEKVKTIIGKIKTLDYKDKDDFVAKMMELLMPLIHDRVFDPEVIARAEEIEKREKGETFPTGDLEVNLSPSSWDFKFSDGTEIKKGDLVLDVNWPEETKVLGAESLKRAFQEIINLLKKNKNIKAVTAVSWMMSHRISDRIGFEKFPDLKVEPEVRRIIVGLVETARRDKPYNEKVKEEDVIVGAISREKFIEKFS